MKNILVLHSKALWHNLQYSDTQFSLEVSVFIINHICYKENKLHLVFQTFRPCVRIKFCWAAGKPDYLNPTAYLPALWTAEQNQHGRAAWSHQHLAPFVQCVLCPRWKGNECDSLAFFFSLCVLPCSFLPPRTSLFFFSRLQFCVGLGVYSGTLPFYWLLTEILVYGLHVLMKCLSSFCCF